MVKTPKLKLLIKAEILTSFFLRFRSRLAAWIGTIIAVFITVAMKNLLFSEQGDAKVLYSTGEKV